MGPDNVALAGLEPIKYPFVLNKLSKKGPQSTKSVMQRRYQGMNHTRETMYYVLSPE